MKKKSKDKIDRRNFIKAGSTAFAGLTLLQDINFGQRTAAKADLSQRRVFPLNNKWLFSEKGTLTATSHYFDDRAFKRVTIPHTNKMLPWHGFDDKEYQFVSIYRRHFRLPQVLRGRRIFVDFGGVMTAATVVVNGTSLGEHRGGYTHFSYEITNHVDWTKENVLAVLVDSTERKDIPPFGGEIDYLTFGGIYRDVQIRVVSNTFIENVFAKPVNVLNQRERRVDVKCYINRKDNETKGNLKLSVELLDGEKIIATTSKDLLATNAAEYDLTLTNLDSVEYWEIDKPKLYDVRVRLLEGTRAVDHYETRIGFREARFTPEGFKLNGKILKLRGLNRHQTYPYVGQAMPARVQRRDAWVLRKELKCNIVRTSHYPQSPHFLDACDEFGLLVLEEIPGWQHIGDDKWQDLSVKYVEAMITRDWNHPSIILWGVRINESRDNDNFYRRTNAVAHVLDDSRQTGGIRNKYDSNLLEDVFTMNEFRIPLREPNHPLYLITEFIGHMYPTKRNDNIERVTEHAMRHARVHNQIGSDRGYAGGIGWCAFDYNTHDYFCSGDRICYHGVADIFRIPKPAGGFYKSQCSPNEEIVLEPAFDWARGDRDETFNIAMINSNCDRLKVYIGNRLITELEPDKKTFPNLPHPPFMTNLREGIGKGWGDLKIEGYIDGKLVITKMMSGKGVDKQLLVTPDDTELFGDGIDATRVVLRVTDEYGSSRPFANAAIALSITGPGEIIGENPFSLFGGVGAVWIKTKEAVGVITLKAVHPVLGAKTVSIKVNPLPPDRMSAI